jgi:hypothetical protein
MPTFLVLLFLYAGLGLFPYWVVAIPTISVVGSKFFTSEGSQFFIKGEVSEQKAASINPLLIS